MTTFFRIVLFLAMAVPYVADASFNASGSRLFKLGKKPSREELGRNWACLGDAQQPEVKKLSCKNPSRTNSLKLMDKFPGDLCESQGVLKVGEVPPHLTASLGYDDRSIFINYRMGPGQPSWMGKEGDATATVNYRVSSTGGVQKLVVETKAGPSTSYVVCIEQEDLERVIDPLAGGSDAVPALAPRSAR